MSSLCLLNHFSYAAVHIQRQLNSTSFSQDVQYFSTSCFFLSEGAKVTCSGHTKPKELKRKRDKVTVRGELFPSFITPNKGAKWIPLGQKGQAP